MITISKTFDFDAAHFLPKVPKGHKCRRMHGHTYRVEIICEAEEVDDCGMVVDYAEIAEAWAPIHALLDHQTLNEVKGLENPTTEILAPWIFAHLYPNYGNSRARAVTVTTDFQICLVAVKVYESSSTWCEYRP